MNSHLSLPTVKILSLALLPAVFTGIASATPVAVEATTLSSTDTTTLATGSAAGNVEIRPGGLLIARGTVEDGVTTASPELLLSDDEEGPTMLWHPRKGAFFAGIAKSYVITDQNMGKGSAAFGDGSAALGDGALAFGVNSLAEGFGSLAGGELSMASGGYSVALGMEAFSYGESSVALGMEVFSFGESSVSMGKAATTWGDGAVALGVETDAMGYGSTATGVNSEAMATASFSGGYRTVADAYGSFAIGSLNTGGGNPGVWVPTDPLFEIGNGDPVGTTASNAVTVYKNGNVDLNGDVQVQGVITCAPGGDIPMFSAE